MKNKINILYVHFGEEWIRGSERCLIDLLSDIDRERFNILVWCNSRVLCEELDKRDIETVRTDFTVLFGWDHPKLDFFNFSHLTKISLDIIQNKKIDLIHANSGAPNQWLAIPSRIKKIPLITHLHAPYILRDRLTLCLHHAHHIVGVSNAVASAFIDDGRESKKISVIYNGIDVERLLNLGKSKRIYPIDEQNSSIRFTTIGSLIERKGVDVCIHTIKALITIGYRCSLTVIGDGPLRDTLKAQVETLGISESVNFIGEQKDPFVWLKHCTDIYISCPNEEAFGLTFAEAGLAKLPVIATRVGGIPEVVVHNKTGVLVDPGDHLALVNAAINLIEKPVHRKSLGKNGFRRVIKKFSINENRKRFEKLYVDTINEIPGHSFRYLKNILINRIKNKNHSALEKISYLAGE
ncbi:MAG: glycosyltransferase [Agarilytica sp.]